jgi:hypothetical protein
MNDEEIKKWNLPRTLLGKHTFWSKLNYYFLYIPWMGHPNAKSHDEFYHGIIPHKHEYDYEHIFYESGCKLARCKHYGCYLCDPVSLKEMLEDSKKFRSSQNPS